MDALEEQTDIQSFEALRPLADVPSIHRLRWGDINGDDKPDLVVAPLFGPRARPPEYDQDNAQLLVDGCEIADPSTVGDGKHLRFRVRQHGRDSGQAIAFGLGSQLDRFRREARYDVAFRLQENRWNGTVAPQLVDEGAESLRNICGCALWFARRQHRMADCEANESCRQ